jgi:hypothetical protein
VVSGIICRVSRVFLHPQVAGDAVRDLAQRLGEVGAQKPVLVARGEVFEGIEHRRLHRLRIRIVREHQRQTMVVPQEPDPHAQAERHLPRARRAARTTGQYACAGPGY